jgi:hypothetical protein
LTSFASSLLSIAVLAAFLLAGGGIYLIATGRARTQGVLMLVMTAVLIGNVLIWTV